MSHPQKSFGVLDRTDRCDIPVSALVLGVDPGINGALAFLDPASGALEIEDMPTVEIVSNGKRKRRVCGLGLGRLVGARSLVRNIRAFVEQVGAMPGQGVTSMFSFGRGVGCVDGALGANEIEPAFVPPRVWMHALGIPPRSDKAAHRSLAARLFPAVASLFKRVKDDGRADAALLAYYGLHHSRS